MRIHSFIKALALCFTIIATNAVGEPVRLQLDQHASKVDFDFSSQVITTSGQFTKYTGALLFDERRLSTTKLEITADASSVSMATLPLNQMLVVQNLLRSLPNSQIVFVSDAFTIERGDQIRISGIATTGDKKERISFPARIASVQKGRRLYGTFERSGTIGNARNPTSVLFGNTNTKAAFDLVFR